MKVLIAWAPAVPSYFNAGHRMAMYQLATYVRRHVPETTVHIVDFGALNSTWKEVADTLLCGYDVVVIQNDLDGATGFGRFVKYCREISPQTRILTFGRLSARIPQFFDRYGLDGIVQSGDPELAIAGYLKQMQLGSEGGVPGLRTGFKSSYFAEPGAWLDPSEWTLPDPHDVPHAAYHRLYARDENKFCGIPGRAELVIPVARGCPVGCYFCEVPAREGTKDRRLNVRQVVEYAREARKWCEYDYISMYAPTFTLRETWVLDLCAQFRTFAGRIPWKCTTTLSHLSRELIAEMGAAGCIRVSVGLESAETKAQALLPTLKRSPLGSVLDVASWCNEARIELTCFLVLGIPGTAAAQTYETVQKLQQHGVRVRPTIYADYSMLDSVESEAEIDDLNRQVLNTSELSREDREILYRIYYGDVLSNSNVASRIPTQVPASV